MSPMLDVLDRQFSRTSTSNIGYESEEDMLRNKSRTQQTLPRDISSSVSIKPFVIEFVENTPQGVFDENILHRGAMSQDDRELIIHRLSRFASYRDGWNEKTSIAPNEYSIKETKSLLQIYEIHLKNHNLTPAKVQVFPLNSGGINIVFEKKKLTLEIDISNDFEFSYLLTDDSEFEEESSVTLDKISTLFQILHFKK